MLDTVRERRFQAIGLSCEGGRIYPHVLGTIKGISKSHLVRYEWATPYCAGKSVLDYGCGVGYGSYVVSAVASSVRGFDISAEALKWAEYYARSRDNLVFANQLPDEVFDCVTCFECIEHVPNPDEVLDWLAGHLREYLFISTPIAETGRPVKNPHHLREFAEEEFLAMLSTRFAIDETRIQVRSRAGLQHGLPRDGNASTHRGQVVVCRCKPIVR